jgi:hypothetical protein
LYQKAIGYSYDAVKIFLPYGSATPIYAPYVEHVPPDTTAAIFWLKNRDPDRWRDAWRIETVTGRYVVSDKTLTEDEWIKARGADVIDGEVVARWCPKLPPRFPSETNELRIYLSLAKSLILLIFVEYVLRPIPSVH